MRLASTTIGPADGRAVTFLHGFTQTSSSWMPVVDALGGVRATLIDAPGHGSNSSERGDLSDTADAVAATMPRGMLVGYSMGARIALHVALGHPDVVTSLVLVSGTAGLEDPAERAERRRSDEALADRIESIGTAAFVDEWLAGPMFAGLSEERAMRHDRTTNPATGLADSLRLSGTGTQENLWPRLHALRCPVLVVAGALDPKFVAIARRMAAAIPGARLETVDDAGHTVHLERTEAFVSLLRDWMVSAPR